MDFTYSGEKCLIVLTFSELEIRKGLSYLDTVLNQPLSNQSSCEMEDIVKKDTNENKYYFIFPPEYHDVAGSFITHLMRAFEAENNLKAALHLQDFVEIVNFRLQNIKPN